MLLIFQCLSGSDKSVSSAAFKKQSRSQQRFVFIISMICGKRTANWEIGNLQVLDLLLDYDR